MLFDWSLIIFGTATDPLKGNPHVPNPKPLTVPITSPPQDTTPTARQESDSGKAIVYLRATACKYGESSVKIGNSNLLLLHQKDPGSEPFSEICFESSNKLISQFCEI